MGPVKAQFFPGRTDVDISLRFIAEAIRTEEGGTVVVIRQRDKGADRLGFKADNVVLRAVFTIASRESGPQFPTKTGSPKQIKHGLIIHDFRRGHQDLENDAGFPAINHIMGSVAHIAARLGFHSCCIWIGGTDPQVGEALVATSCHPPILRSQLLYPIMTLLIALSQDFTLLLSKRGGKGLGCLSLLRLRRFTYSLFFPSQDEF